MKSVIKTTLWIIAIILGSAFVFAHLPMIQQSEGINFTHGLSLVYIFLFFAVLITAIVSLIGKIYTLGIGLMCLLLLTSQYWRRQLNWSWKQAQVETTALTVMTYNTRSFSGHGGHEYFGDFLIWLSDHSEVEVMALHEIVRSEFNSIKRNFRNWNALYYNGDNAEVSGTGLFFKGRLLGSEKIDFHHSGNSGVIADVVLAEGDTVRLMAVHLSSNKVSGLSNALFDHPEDIGSKVLIPKLGQMLLRYGKGISARKNDWNQLKAFIDNTPYPIILAGDMNDTPYSSIYQKVNKHLRDSFLRAGRGFSSTYTERFLGLRIDYIFTTDDFETMLHKELVLPFSDHKVVEARLSLSNHTN